MGFEVFVQCFDNGKAAGVSRAAVRALFPVVENESQPEYWEVRYDDLNQSQVSVFPLKTDSELLECICVQRPCGDIRLWDALFSVMCLGNAVFYFPGSAPLVASEDVVKHIPDDMIEGLGEPVVVTSGKDLISIVQSS